MSQNGINAPNLANLDSWTKDSKSVAVSFLLLTLGQHVVCLFYMHVLPPFEKESPHVWDFHTFPSQGITFFNIFNYF